MSTPRAHRLPALLAAVLAPAWLAFFSATTAHAGVFDDDEARRQINDLRVKANERLDTVSKGQIDLAGQIQSLKDEVAKLRGQVETLSYELESANKRQQDFYVDLDGRLRKIEPPAGGSPAADAQPAEAAPKPAAPAADPAAETQAYEAALNLFKAGKYKDAATAFEAFGKAHPDAPLAPSAQYWLGNAHYALRDCKKAIAAQSVVMARWPEHAKAPDALLNIASCQQELGDAKAAKKSLETVVAKYPGSPAADAAKQRLKKK